MSYLYQIARESARALTSAAPLDERLREASISFSKWGEKPDPIGFETEFKGIRDALEGRESLDRDAKEQLAFRVVELYRDVCVAKNVQSLEQE